MWPLLRLLLCNCAAVCRVALKSRLAKLESDPPADTKPGGLFCFWGRFAGMKASNALWQERLAGKLPDVLAREIDIFETEIALRKQGKMDERLFAETRLRRGVYGQRYDNGQRHDGEKVSRWPMPPAT